MHTLSLPRVGLLLRHQALLYGRKTFVWLAPAPLAALYARLPYVQVHAVIWFAATVALGYYLWKYAYAAYLYRVRLRQRGWPRFWRAERGHVHFLLGACGLWAFLVLEWELGMSGALFLGVYGLLTLAWDAFARGWVRPTAAVGLGLCHVAALVNFCLEVWGPGSYRPLAQSLVIVPVGLLVGYTVWGLFRPDRASPE